MIASLLAVALAGVPARAAAGPNDAQPYGILLLAYDVDVAWRKELGSLAKALKGHAVEIVTSAGDRVSVQRAVDRLTAQRVGKIIAVPIETMSDAPWLEQARFLFGVSEQSAPDRPDPPTGDLADRPLKILRAKDKPTLNLPTSAKRLTCARPLILAPALDKSDLLADILADRAKTAAKDPAREGLVLIGIAPRSDAALKDWLTSANGVASKIGARAGFREAIALGVREGVRSDQQDKDRQSLRAAVRGLIRKGRVVVVPLSPQAERTHEMFKRSLGGFFAYRWNGQGIRGDRRLTDWIKASAEQGALGAKR